MFQVAPRTQGCGGQGDTSATTTEIHHPPPSKPHLRTQRAVPGTRTQKQKPPRGPSTKSTPWI